MLTFDNIMERLKVSINYKNKTNVKYSNKQLAFILEIKPASYGSMKARETIPFKIIIDYCNNNSLDLNYIFKD